MCACVFVIPIFQNVTVCARAADEIFLTDLIRDISQRSSGATVEVMNGAEGQNRTGYAGLFRAALYQ